MTRTSCRCRAAVAFALALVASACGGSLSIIPTGPTPVAGTPPPTPTPTPAPTPTPPPPGPDPALRPRTIHFAGTLADGGEFWGYIMYGPRDFDDRPTYGRYQGGLWEVAVKGGRTTRDFVFKNDRGGRALIETYEKPFPAIGIVLLFPREDPAVQGLTPHVRPNEGYDPDTTPELKDFGELIPGQINEFGTFADGTGRRVLVTSIQISSEALR